MALSLNVAVDFDSYIYLPVPLLEQLMLCSAPGVVGIAVVVALCCWPLVDCAWAATAVWCIFIW